MGPVTAHSGHRKGSSVAHLHHALRQVHFPEARDTPRARIEGNRTVPSLGNVGMHHDGASVTDDQSSRLRRPPDIAKRHVGTMGALGEHRHTLPGPAGGVTRTDAHDVTLPGTLARAVYARSESFPDRARLARDLGVYC